MRPFPFAARKQWELAPNRLAQALESHRRAGREVLDLTESNPTRCGFRYDSTLGNTGGYVFNLKTTGLATGTYKLNFTVGSAPTDYSVQFQVK